MTNPRFVLRPSDAHRNSSVKITCSSYTGTTCVRVGTPPIFRSNKVSLPARTGLAAPVPAPCFKMARRELAKKHKRSLTAAGIFCKSTLELLTGAAPDLHHGSETKKVLMGLRRTAGVSNSQDCVCKRIQVLPSMEPSISQHTGSNCRSSPVVKKERA